MSYKTIMTVLTDTDQGDLLQNAAQLARQYDAHLDVLCLGVDHSQAGYFYAGTSAYIVQDTIDRALEHADSVANWARDGLAGHDLRWTVEPAVAAVGGLTPVVAFRARFADLVVLAPPYTKNAAPDAEAITEAALFEGCAPVLILPEQAPPMTVPMTAPDRIMLAWNQSEEALAAARRALPLLVAAKNVEITVIDPPRNGAERSDPGGALCQMLTRHGAKVDIAVLARTQPKISDILNRRATETGADLLVMGAYGHSRFREAILGGATRDILEEAKVPVFLAR